MVRTCGLFVLTCACTQPASTTLFVTTASDGDGEVSLGLLVDGRHVTAYACSDDPASDPYPGWFRGDLAADGSFNLSLAGWTLSGNVQATSARGTIHEPDGTLVDWSSELVDHAPLTGLYTSDASCQSGVIVIADDPARAPIVRGAFCNVMQVTPVMPLALVDDRLPVDVQGWTEWRTYMTPLREPP